MEYKRQYKLVKAAYLIYRERLPLQDVAKALGVSRPTLARMIDEIHLEEIVTIQIKDPAEYQKNLELASGIKKRYGLKDVAVAQSFSDSAEDIADAIGTLGAEYLCDIIRGDMTVGTTGGRTIFSLISHLEPNKNLKNIKIVTMTGGSLYVNTKYHSNTIAQQLAELTGGAGYFIYAPNYADNRHQRDILLQNSQIAETMNLCKTIDVALVGIGDAVSAREYLPLPVQHMFDGAPESDLAGAVNTLLISKNGEPFFPPVSDLLVGVNYEELKRIPSTIGLAGGAEKHAAIRASILGKYVNVLITDQYTAEYLLWA